ncbi:MAG: divalent-cation tolerance protein CutA [Patescibacteria group bacterium]
MKFSLIYITCKNQKEAQKIAKAVVDKKLAACANIFPKIKSYYRWHGKAVWDQERVLILKTKKANLNKVIKKVKGIHSYKIPCILAFEIKGGNKEYLNWLDKAFKF